MRLATSARTRENIQELIMPTATLTANPSAAGDHKVVLLSPRLPNRSVMLGSFVQSRSAYFYALTRDDTTLDAFLRGLIRSLAEDSPGLLTQTTQALDARKVELGDVAEALVADLRALKAHLLILDNFDFLGITDDVIAFLEKLVEALPGDLQLVINARHLSYAPWQSMVHSGEAVVLGEEQALDGGILTSETDANHPHLEVSAFGQGKVFVNGREIVEWDGPLVRNLFFFFVDHEHLTRDEIFETFWSGVGQRAATNVFHVTKRKITERLGFEMTDYSSRFYRPSKDVNLHYDVAHFEREIAQAIRQDKPSVETWLHAIRLYRNPYLMTSAMPWIEERREALRLQYTTALLSVARIHQSHAESDRAIHFYLRALLEGPDREDIHRELMSLYASRGESDKALKQYQVLKSHLRRSYGIAPSEATRKVYSLLAGKVT